ncbi:hypothetical protein FOZ60_016380 [Perkinsus olseni]|uniref:Uncharacterized protein n=1 Tax=Perkinsus olseni TaxID=32597 RepID=A0A7J6P584_PEROL|nr:hypothetical protein FOZ60_016380 [Perkinsus olseni]
MYTPRLAFLHLLYVVRSAAPTYNPVVKEELPSGTYRAKERGAGRTCPALPGLTDFEVVVREDKGRQVASLRAKVGDEWLTADEESRLVWYNDRFVKGTKKRKIFRTHQASKCFHPASNSGKRGASARFMRSLYHSMGKSDARLSGAAFAFCLLVGSSDILVLIGLETRHTRLADFDAALLLCGPAGRTAHNAAPPPVASSLIDWKGALELPDTSGLGEPPGSYDDVDQAELMDRYFNFDESEQLVDDRDHLTGGGDGFELGAALPDGDYETFYGTARIGVGVATTTDDNCMQLALPSTNWSLSVHVIRTFLDHGNFLPNKISICYKTDLGWSLEFHEKGTGNPLATGSTGALKLNKIGYGRGRK